MIDKKTIIWNGKTMRDLQDKYEIGFVRFLIVCIFLIGFSKFYTMFDAWTPLFVHADEIYHFVAEALNIISNISYSIISAIVFYYILSFYHSKGDSMWQCKKLEFLCKTTLHEFVSVFEDADGFQSVKKCNTNDYLYCVDLHIALMELFEKSRNEDKYESLIIRMKEFIINKNLAEGYCRKLDEFRDELNSLSSLSYIQNGSEQLDIIINDANKIIAYYEMAKKQEGVLEDSSAFQNFIKSNISFIDNLIIFHNILYKYSFSIGHYKIFTFLKLSA
jgi:hypothetical protein